MKKITVEIAEKILTEYMKNSGYKPLTINSNLTRLRTFLEYIRDHTSIKDLRDIRYNDLVKYKEYLNNYKSKYKNQLLKGKGKYYKFHAVRMLYRAMYVSELIIADPVEEIPNYNKLKEQEKQILAQEEMGTILDSINDPRDRAIFELAYSSGLRRGEIINLNYEDVDFENRLLHIRLGKFSKDRIVPISKVAVYYLKKYIPVPRANGQPLFYGKYGRLSKNNITNLFRRYLQKNNLYREGLSLHSIRHSISTHLLENGTNIRYVQELLGHENLETTVRYTHMLYEATRRIYKTYHPKENEFYEEVTDEYLDKLEDFRKQLEKMLAEREKYKKVKNRYYRKMREKQTAKTKQKKEVII